MLAGMGDELDWYKIITPLSLFDPLGVAEANSEAILHAGILAACGLVLCLVGTAVFSKRDLAI